MKVVKPMKVAVLTRVLERVRRPQFHVAAMIGFPLDAPRALADELAFWAGVTSALGDSGVLDEGFSKARGELVAAGSFHAPAGPVPASYVRAKLGSIDKRLAVIGDRVWRDNVATAPEPMTTMPLDWAHAFGGAKFDRNPSEVAKVALVAQEVDSILTRVTQRAKRVFRVVEEIDQTRAGTVDVRAQNLVAIRGENALISAQVLAKVDGEQIHIG